MSWPSMPCMEAATLLAIQYQLQQAEQTRLPELESLQMQQLHSLFSHLFAHEPFYRSRLNAAGFSPSETLTLDQFRSLPITSRAELQEAGEQAFCTHIPMEHGQVRKGITSGSTGRALTYAKTGLADFLWNAVTLHESLLSGWDLRGRLAVCRAGSKDGEHASWGRPESIVYETGPASVRNIRTDLQEQAQWLTAFKPDYLITNPTNLRGLCEWFAAHGSWKGHLKGVRTLGEVVTPELRDLCQAVLDAGIRDMYSAAEAGYIALQCTEHTHYHVQSGVVLAEVLHKDGSPCLPGEIGQVVITTLHNFAMPLIRYAIGDYAEVGDPCPDCKGLPTLKRIMGRSRNLLTLPDGRKWWPPLPPKKYMHIAPIKQLQLVQKSLDTIEARLAVERLLDQAQEEALVQALKKMLKHPFQFKLVYLPEIGYGPNHKFEDFISEIE